MSEGTYTCEGTYTYTCINKKRIYTRILGPAKAGHTNRHKTQIILKSFFFEKHGFVIFSFCFVFFKMHFDILGVVCIINWYFE